MKNIVDFLKESVDDNTLWKLDTWFNLHPNELSEFEELLILYNQNKSLETISNFIAQSFYYIRDYKEFINFIEDDIEPNNEKEYIQEFEIILKYILDNKSYKNIYQNCIA